MADVIKIANCSGFYGDKISAARDMVEGRPIDVLTGDYLAELTMTILYAQKQKRASGGYVGTFLKQVKDVLATRMEKNIKIVTNAGSLNPSGMSDEIKKIADDLGLSPKVAYIDGDDLMPRMAELQAAGESFNNMDRDIALSDSGNTTLTANAYLGAWGIKEALDQGADDEFLVFNSEFGGIQFLSAWSRIALTPNPDILQSYFQKRIQRLERLYPNRLQSKIQYLLTLALSSGECHLQQIAQTLDMHPRVLQKKLKNEGTSFSKLLEVARLDIACQQLRNSEVSITNLALRLGYSDISVFSRRFKLWIGQSPKRWRQASH